LKIVVILVKMSEETNKTPPPSPNKRHRVSAGTAERMQPSKKSKIDEKPKAKSAFLLLITKGGTKYQHLNDDEYRKLMLNMATSLLRKPRREGGYPHIDWHSQTAGRSLMACDDEKAVSWVKSYMAELGNDIGAWLPYEGPNAHALQCMVPHPTGSFSAEEILNQMMKTNEFQGNFTILYSKKTERAGHFIRFSVDAELLSGLQDVGFKPFCLITRLNIFNSRDRARNKEKVYETSTTTEVATEEDILMSEEANVNAPNETPHTNPLPPAPTIESWSDDVEIEEALQAMQQIQPTEVEKIKNVPRAASCPVPVSTSTNGDENIIATVGVGNRGPKNAAIKKTPPSGGKLPFYRRQ